MPDCEYSFVDSLPSTSTTPSNASSLPSLLSTPADDLSSDYATNICVYMRYLERKYPICRGKLGEKPLLCRQAEVTSRHRRLVVDWLAELARYFRLKTETFHLAVSMLDRLFDRMRCPIDRLQLLGATTLMLASKIEEYEPLRLSHVIEMCSACRMVTPATVATIERKILKTFAYRLHFPTAYFFAGYFHMQIGSTALKIHMTSYLLELITLDDDYRRYRDSELAAAAIVAARMILNGGGKPMSPIWPAEIESVSGISPIQLFGCVLRIIDTAEEVTNRKMKPIAFSDYCRPERFSVALIPVSKMKITWE